ncbi:MAG: hypothetical protein BWZ02_02106 [Lentisphaerae bacterium ADurb.BinA184]|nr:MAG: hypothetical protein BWZ02_02106 [Lentisphaerae bacterium ADurb.BinA184]
METGDWVGAIRAHRERPCRENVAFLAGQRRTRIERIKNAERLSDGEKANG